jgi:hypothetical protein
VNYKVWVGVVSLVISLKGWVLKVEDKINEILEASKNIGLVFVLDS